MAQNGGSTLNSDDSTVQIEFQREPAKPCLPVWPFLGANVPWAVNDKLSTMTTSGAECLQTPELNRQTFKQHPCITDVAEQGARSWDPDWYNCDLFGSAPISGIV